MNAIEFARWVQGYYGQYTRGQKLDIWQYLQKLDESYLTALKKELLTTYSGKWGKPPDIAIFEECRQAIEQDQAERMKYRQYLPPAEEDEQLMTPEEAKRFFEEFDRLLKKKHTGGKGA
jgi:hypothetical protein